MLSGYRNVQAFCVSFWERWNISLPLAPLQWQMYDFLKCVLRKTRRTFMFTPTLQDNYTLSFTFFHKDRHSCSNARCWSPSVIFQRLAWLLGTSMRELELVLSAINHLSRMRTLRSSFLDRSQPAKCYSLYMIAQINDDSPYACYTVINLRKLV